MAEEGEKEEERKKKKPGKGKILALPPIYTY